MMKRTYAKKCSYPEVEKTFKVPLGGFRASSGKHIGIG